MDCATGLGITLVAQHRKESGTQMLGAADSLREEFELGPRDPKEEELHERALADAKSALGAEAYAAAWARGRAMNSEEIVKFGRERS